MAESISNLAADIADVRAMSNGNVSRTIELVATTNTLRDTVQSLATNMATLTQTLMGNERNRKIEMDYVKDYLDIVKMTAKDMSDMKMWRAEQDGVIKGAAEATKRIVILELWKATQEGSIKTVITMVLSVGSMIGVIAGLLIEYSRK